MNAAAQSPRLDGASLVLTRVDGGALARRARRLGATCVSVPGLALRMNADPAVAAALRSRARFDDWIFSSPAAVQFAHRLAAPLRLRNVRVFALGAGTRAALARHGIEALAPGGRGDSESLLALPTLADVRGRRIAVVGAPGGRDLIAPALRARQASSTCRLPIPLRRATCSRPQRADWHDTDCDVFARAGAAAAGAFR
jgi:uroporphyrinogen-III synthase